MLGADTRADIADTLIKKRQSLYYLQIEWTSGAPGYKKRGILNVKHCFASKHLNSLLWHLGGMAGSLPLWCKAYAGSNSEDPAGRCLPYFRKKKKSIRQK